MIYSNLKSFKIIKSNQETIKGECNRTYVLGEGDQIDILVTKQSAYGYMALEGGFDIKPFCKSVSILSSLPENFNSKCTSSFVLPALTSS